MYQANPGGTVPGFRLQDGSDIAALVAVMNASPNLQTKQIISASGAGKISLSNPLVIITAGATATLTLPAPASPAQDGLELSIISTTGFAHTVTATGLFNNGTAAVNLATFAAFSGANLQLVAFGGEWYVTSQNAVTIT